FNYLVGGSLSESHTGIGDTRNGPIHAYRHCAGSHAVPPRPRPSAPEALSRGHHCAHPLPSWLLSRCLTGRVGCLLGRPSNRLLAYSSDASSELGIESLPSISKPIATKCASGSRTRRSPAAEPVRSTGF